jgi:hypothetical protein
VDYSSERNETCSDAEQSETGDDIRVSFVSDSVVYFLGADNGLVKIGFASNFRDRYSKLNCGSPLPLYPLAITHGGRVEEREYHERFKEWRRHGEWFELTDKLEEEIDRINLEQNPLCIPARFRGFAPPLTLTVETFPW